MSHLSSLARPLDTLLDLFTSIHIPNDNSTSQIENTLTILTTIMNSYDTTFIALQNARDELTHLDSKHVLNQHRLTEFSQIVTSKMQQIRSQLVQQAQDVKQLQNERHVLRHRLAQLEKERKTQDELILSMATKLNETEERNLGLVRLKKWRQHWDGQSIMRDPAEKPPGSVVRDRQKKSDADSRGRSRSRKRSVSKPRKSRSRSKKKEVLEDWEPFEQTLRETKSNRMNPAKTILLNKLKQVDLEIDQLARELLLQ
ncbi:hypothetical protein EDD86DRAFT_244810 [Gorgonomyces haynaldii]|nr:hypothetical protein EDD86DRAFT_244810 [Gorgonomyces haynaldii]